MAKKYYEGLVTRFFLWPKTILWGNEFHYQEADTSTKENGEFRYLIEQYPKSNNIFLRLFAWIALPLFNPIAFCLIKLKNLTNKEPFDKKEQEAFGKKEQELLKRWFKFREKLTDETVWDKPEIVEEFNKFYSEAVNNFKYLLNVMGQTIEKEKLSDPTLNNPTTLAERIVRQRNYEKEKQQPIFSYPLIYSTLFELYHAARERQFYQPKTYGNRKYYMQRPDRDMKLHENAPSFYNKETEQHKWRKNIIAVLSFSINNLVARNCERN